MALLLAVLFPVPSPAADPGASGEESEASAATSGEEAASKPVAEADEEGAAEERSEASASDESEASSDESEASSDESEASGEESEKPAAEASADEGEGEEESAFASLAEYGRNVRTQFLTGLNGMLTSPADPVMAAVNPPKAFDKASYTYERRTLGFGSGILLMFYRAFTGTLDLALAPGPLPVLSPVPRYKLIPGFEHEDE